MPAALVVGLLTGKQGASAAGPGINYSLKSTRICQTTHGTYRVQITIWGDIGGGRGGGHFMLSIRFLTNRLFTASKGMISIRICSRHF